MIKADRSKNTNSREAKQSCPNCGESVKKYSRYPNYLCRNCVKLITDKNGRKVAFYNTHLLGYGCQGYYVDRVKKEKYNSNICFIRNQKYFVEEARFGGIVIQEMCLNSNERS